MDNTIIFKYKNLNFNLKNIIFSHLPIYQIITHISKIDKSTLIALNKNRLINFVKNNYHQTKGLFSEYKIKSIDKLKNICNNDSNLKENNIDEIIVFLFIVYFSSIEERRTKYLQ